MARSTAATIPGCSMRLSKQERLRNLEATKEAYRAKSREADEARRLADAGEGHYRRETILREEAVLIARDLNEVMNVIPGLLVNGCADAALKAAWNHARTIRASRQNAFAKATSELEENNRLLKNVERDLDKFFPGDWQKIECADGIWKPVLGRPYEQNMLDELTRAAVELQHARRIQQRVYDESSAELDAAKQAYTDAREALIWSPI